MREENNLKALEFELPAGLSKQLDEASANEPGFPYLFYSPAMQAMIAGGTDIRREPKWFR